MGTGGGRFRRASENRFDDRAAKAVVLFLRQPPTRTLPTTTPGIIFWNACSDLRRTGGRGGGGRPALAAVPGRSLDRKTASAITSG